MYLEDRAKWWIKKSRNTSHQRAYNNIARFLGGRSWLDVGCGSGEVMQRGYMRGGFERAIGIDGTRLMVKEAQNVLKNKGLKSKIVRPEEIGGKGIYLVEGDILDTDLSKLEIDFASIIFPELYTEAHKISGHPVRNLMRRHFGEGFETGSKRGISYNFYFLRNLLKIGGKVLITNYQTVLGEGNDSNEAALEEYQSVAGLFGIDLKSIQFFESRIWNDAVRSEDEFNMETVRRLRKEGHDIRTGYFVIQGEKTRDVSF